MKIWVRCPYCRGYGDNAANGEPHEPCLVCNGKGEIPIPIHERRGLMLHAQPQKDER